VLTTNHAPLSGVRVLDLSRILAAPLAAQMLGDLGAEVIKVERPGSGDDSRSYGPPFLCDAEGNPSAEAGFYLSANRNKSSITIDHSMPEGAELVRALACRSDVLIENFRPGVLERYGLGYDALHELHPGLVYCSITGYGQDGPYADRPGYDGVFQAMSGMMSVSGLADGEPGAGPVKVGISMIDIVTGLYAGNAILAALRHRDILDGSGQHIDLSLLDCGVASLSHYAQNYLVSGVAAPRRGNGGFGGIPSQTFRCADGAEIFLVASTPGQWASLAKVIGRPELGYDERFATVSARIVNRDLVLRTLDAVFRTRNVADWLTDLEAADVPVAPVNDMDDVFANPQVRHRDLRITVDHPVSGHVDLLRSPIRMSESPITTYATPPALGQHSHEILSSVLGKTPAEIRQLEQAGVV
jgi:crotonobetainyl-CoA:carnitine CoA-transferase CaiB-like acyl-CoA transferase